MIHCRILNIIVFGFYISGGAGLWVELRAPKYVAEGGAATLKCDYSVPHDYLHKVEWFRDGHKIFQFVKGRKPPFRNYSTPGAHIDWSHSNEKQVMLKEMELEASGSYSCEVSTDTPIYTKPSDDHEITVIQKQQEEPRIWFGKPRYQEGEWLQVNCTTGPAKPPPHVTWLVNGHQVDEWMVKSYKGKGGVRTAQLGMEMGAEHVGELRLTCLSTIPAYSHHTRHSDYADSKQQTIAIEVVSRPKPAPKPEVRPSSSLSAGTGPKCSRPSSTAGAAGSRLAGPHLLLLLLPLFTDIR